MLIQQQNNIAMYFLPLIFYSNSKTLNIHGMIFQELIQAMLLPPCYLVSSWISNKIFSQSEQVTFYYGLALTKFFSPVHMYSIGMRIVWWPCQSH